MAISFLYIFIILCQANPNWCCLEAKYIPIQSSKNIKCGEVALMAWSLNHIPTVPASHSGIENEYYQIQISSIMVDVVTRWSFHPFHAGSVKAPIVGKNCQSFINTNWSMKTNANASLQFSKRWFKVTRWLSKNTAQGFQKVAAAIVLYCIILYSTSSTGKRKGQWSKL